MDDTGLIAARLGAQRAEVRARIADLDRDLAAMTAARTDANLDDEHDPEGATVGAERAQLAAVLQAARDRLSEIDAAVARVEAGIYGRCEECGARIDTDRLDARPTARRCRVCV